MSGLPRQPLEIPFDGGLLTRGDARAKPTPTVEQLLNAEFDDVGGLRVRYPFGVTNMSIVGGGTIANARRFFPNGDEIVLFTDTALYTWQAQLSAWQLIGTHLAVATDEKQIFTTNDDQFFTDRAELNGAVFYTWATAATCFIAVVDKVTGAVLLNPTVVDTGTVATPRVVALATKVLLFYSVATALRVTSIDPANPAKASWGTVHTLSGAFSGSYDAVKIPSVDAAVLVAAQSAGASYYFAQVTAALALTQTTKARSVGNAIAVAVTPDGVHAQVVRDNGHIFGDLITVATLADVFTNTDLGAPGGTLNHIAAAYRSVKAAGQYRCYAFFSSSENTNENLGPCKTAWIDDANNISSAAPFANYLSVASRAFDYNGAIYVWLAFAGASEFVVGATPVRTIEGALQNTYFLYRDDAFLVAKSVDNVGAGNGGIVGLLPGVALVGGTTQFAWSGTERRIVPVGESTGSDGAYAARAPRDVLFAFDDNRARRCVRIGRTLYISGGLILQYDGSQIVELGWQAYPWAISAAGTAGTGIADGSYGVKNTQRWDNAQGERDRSTTATTLTIALTGGPQSLSIGYLNLFITRKTSPATALEIWRTMDNGSNYFLSSSLDPTKTTPNNYITNVPGNTGFSFFIDSLPDASLAVREAYPETGGVLENLPPPAANIIVASDTRIFLADCAGQPDTVWYSKQRLDGQVASFNDALTFSVPIDGGKITAIAQLEAGIVVWRENATYLFSGSGFDNNGGGANYSLSRIISTTNGAESIEAVAYGDLGWFVRTSTGWCMLNKAFTYAYVGQATYRYDSEPVLQSTMLTDRQQFRVVTPNRVLVLDTNVDKWGEWTIADGLDMIVDSAGACWYLTATGPRKEITTWTGYTGTDYTLALVEVETQWIKPDGRQQGRYVVDYLQILGEWRSTCVIRGQLAKDYEQTAPGTPNWHTDKTWTPTPTINGNALELRMSPAKKRCASIKARISITAPDGVSPLGGPCARLTSLTGQYAVEPGIYSALSSGQKQ